MSFLAIPFPAIDPVAISIGPVSIKWYGLAYVAGLLLGWLYVKRLLATRSLWPDEKPPFAPEVVDDLFIWVALGVVIGGRLGHVLLYEPGYFLSHPLDILQIWRGGMAFHGGMLGTILAMWLFARHMKVSALSVMDLVSAAVPIGLFFGRIANFINAEVVGLPSRVPWAMVFPGYGPEPRHPAQLYESLLEGFVLFLILRWMIYHRRALHTPGVIGAVFLIGYGGFRMICELFKEDEYRGFLAQFFLTTGMAYCVPMVIIGAVGYWAVTRKPETA
ncbi:MAG: prolipoprotein diacylglyceryl transferase [Proteobacteria bacterium]|nr:prolipoprotein diacylglyceryl transferase [Pseudomonadota bacterium]